MRASLLYTAWKKLVFAYVLGYAAGLLAGIVLVRVLAISPDALFEMSTKRLSYAYPLMEAGAKAGIDGGILLFLWNGLAALATMTFAFTAVLFNPAHANLAPRRIRSIFCSPRPMKLLCFLPGCRKIGEESVRRTYVWLMVPLIGMILLGIETGLSASTARQVFGSFLLGIVSLLPHGIIEIPAIALAGAVTYSAHLLIRPRTADKDTQALFDDLKRHTDGMPIRKIAFAVVTGLFIAAMVEAHVTPILIEWW